MLLSTNPINSVLFLIIIFFSISFLFIFLSADFLGILILIIYVGAIAVLFLFIVMLTNIKRVERDTNVYMTIGILVTFELFMQFTYAFSDIAPDYINLMSSAESDFFFYNYDLTDELSRKYILYYIGFIIFYEHAYLILYSGLILLLSIVISIYLTNFKNGISIRKQYNAQV